MVAQVVEAKLSVIQGWRKIAQCETVLATIARLIVGTTRERGTTANGHQLRWQANVTATKVAAATYRIIQIGVDHWLRHQAKIEHGVASAGGGEVVGGKERAHRLRLNRTPIKHGHRFQRHVLG